MRSILGLFEGVVTGAADGYGRMRGTPACTLLHLGPGLANGLANLHNARRAHTPIVNIVGEHATYHRHLDAPLTSNIHGFAEPVSGWIRTVESADDTSSAGVAAVQASLAAPGQIATLIAPADSAWSDTDVLTKTPDLAVTRQPFDEAAVVAAADAIRKGAKVAFLLNASALTEAALADASRIAQAGATGKVALFGDTFIARVARGAGRVDLPRLPYFAEQAIEALGELDYLIVAGTKAPVSFFAYPGVPSELTPSGAELITLAGPAADAEGALQALASALQVDKKTPILTTASKVDKPRGELNPETIAQSLAAQLPDLSLIHI